MTEYEIEDCDVLAGLASGFRSTARILRDSAKNLERRAAKLEEVSKRIEPKGKED